MVERLNLVDCYDLACAKDELERKIICQYNNDISPMKKSLQLHKQRLDVKDNQLSIIKEQITGIGEIIISLGNEIDKNKEIAIEANRKTNFDKTRFDKLLLNKSNRLSDKINETNEIIKNYDLSKMTVDITNNQYEIDELKFKSNFMFYYHSFLLFIIFYFWSS